MVVFFFNLKFYSKFESFFFFKLIKQQINIFQTKNKEQDMTWENLSLISHLKFAKKNYYGRQYNESEKSNCLK